MKQNVYFVSGIDTDAGKSYATGYLAREWNKNGKRTITQKFIQTGNVGDPENGQMHFYVTLPTETVYLFSTKYFSNNIFQLFKNGVPVERLFHSSRNIRRQNIQEHLIRNLKDIEKEYEIPLFQNSRKHFQKTSRNLNKAV